MNDRPIAFSKPMVLALLAGRKTETRRVLNPQPIGFDWFDLKLVRHRVGDRLYVREEIQAWLGAGWNKYVRYAADQHNTFLEWPAAWQRDSARPMHMFKAFSRMTLPVTGVRVERLHDITNTGAIAEGVVLHEDHGIWQDWRVPGVEHPNKDFPYLSRATSREMYAALWDVINGSGAWLSNPWVCVTSWPHVIHQNIDKVKP